MKILLRAVSALGLRIQIGALAAIGMFGLFSLAGFMIWSDMAVTALQVESDRANWIHEKVVAFDRAVLRARIAERGFIATARSDEAATHASMLASADEGLRILHAEIDKAHDDASRDIAKRLGDLRQSAAAYATAFAGLAGQRPTTAQTARLDASYQVIGPQLLNCANWCRTCAATPQPLLRKPVSGCARRHLGSQRSLLASRSSLPGCWVRV